MRAKGAAAAVVLTLLGTMIPARGAPHPPDRVVTSAYAQPHGVVTGDSVTMLRGPAVTEVARADEDRVTISGTTATGAAVGLVVDVTAPGRAPVRHVSCAPLTIKVVYKAKVDVTPVAGQCANGQVTTPYDGTLRLAFRRVPPPKPGAGAPPHLRWAVVIGISDYAGSTRSTVGGLGDAKAVRAALLASGWRSEQILMVTESQATATGIRAAMDWLADVSGPRTFSLLHFSGHVCIASRGPCPSGHTWLWSHDNRFIPETEVWSRMRKVRGYSWLDVAGCEAGAFALSSPTRMFTGSSQADETSYEYADWDQSVFAGLLWDRGYLRGLAHPQGRAKAATIGQMAAYAKDRAPALTRGEPAGAQHPVVRGGSASWKLYAPPGG